MTVDELIAELQKIAAAGGGERIVYMSDPRSADSAEVTGLWIPRDEQAVDLECVEWKNAKGDVIAPPPEDE